MPVLRPGAERLVKPVRKQWRFKPKTWAPGIKKGAVQLQSPFLSFLILSETYALVVWRLIVLRSLALDFFEILISPLLKSDIMGDAMKMEE